MSNHNMYCLLNYISSVPLPYGFLEEIHMVIDMLEVKLNCKANFYFHEQTHKLFKYTFALIGDMPNKDLLQVKEYLEYINERMHDIFEPISSEETIEANKVICTAEDLFDLCT